MAGMQFIVKVGTSIPEGEKDKYPEAELAGENYFGPMSGPDANRFEARVIEAWKNVESSAFVYGVPEVEIILLRGDRSADPYRAAQNWYDTSLDGA